MLEKTDPNMKTKTKYKSEALQALHEMAVDLYEVGAMSLKDLEDIERGCFKCSNTESKSENLTELFQKKHK